MSAESRASDQGLVGARSGDRSSGSSLLHRLGFALLVALSGCDGTGGSASQASGAPSGILTVSSLLEIVDIDVASGATRKVLGGGGLSATVAGGGGLGMGEEYLYVDSDERDGLGHALWRLRPNGVARQWLSIDDPTVTVRPWQPRFSPGGRYVSFLVWGNHPRTGEGEHQPRVLIFENRETVDYRNDVIRVLEGYDAAAWTPASASAPLGRMVLVETDTHRLYVTNAQVRDPTEIPWDFSLGRPTQAEPSPDGHRLVVATEQGDLYVGDFDADRARLDGLRRVRTATAVKLASDPVFSPDGRWIAHLWGTSFRIRDVVLSSAEAEVDPIPVPRADGSGTWSGADSQLWWR